MTEENNEKRSQECRGVAVRDGEFLTPTPSVVPAENWNHIRDDDMFFEHTSYSEYEVDMQ
jgi:hypothetical protein